jgi:hypothetical protein
MAFKDDKIPFQQSQSKDEAFVEQRFSYPFMDLFPFSVLQVIVLLVHIKERCTDRIRDASTAGNGYLDKT